MVIGIMQPYFCPYLGYFQLINKVDQFVIYDNIEYSRRGWFSRNRIAINDRANLFSIPLKRDSDYLHVNDRFLSDSSSKSIAKILRRIENSYRHADYYSEIFPVVKSVFNCQNTNLFDYIQHSVVVWKNLLNINTPLIRSSELEIDHSLKAQNKVIAICKHLNASTYINPIGGTPLYDRKHFSEHGLNIKFLEMNPLKYNQQNERFISSLSVIDVLMHNGIDKTIELLSEYKLKQA
ncbi:MAG: WbqC family protein [Roseivirga sp.]|jgi:hypothetical protein|uniref:WbqC family protein n=1 Tax=Roseivirga sp. TaxID=1964215 RepID=UPI001B18E964|nr:WbqC family protein [Roseivirga sp.]MBO6496913.1 WbqC family protein [Roseivirga sp.]